MNKRRIEWLGEDKEGDFQVYSNTRQTLLISRAFFKHINQGTMREKLKGREDSLTVYAIKTCLLPWEFME